MGPRPLSAVVVRPLNFTVRPHAMRTTLVLIAILALGQTSVSRADPPSPAPALSEDAATRIAVAEAQRQKINLSAYEAPSARFLGGHTWAVIFSSKGYPAVKCMWIYVDDLTGKADPIRRWTDFCS